MVDENRTLEALWFSQDNQWRMQIQSRTAGRGSGSKRVFTSLARQAGKGLSGQHREDSFLCWLDALKQNGCGKDSIAGSGTISESRAGELRIADELVPPRCGLQFVPSHISETGEHRDDPVGFHTQFVEEFTSYLIEDVFRTSANFCLELRSRSTESETVGSADGGSDRCEDTRRLAEEVASSVKEVIQLRKAKRANSETPAPPQGIRELAEVPELPSEFQQAFEVARAKADTEFIETAKKYGHVPDVMLWGKQVRIQKVFFAYCAEARNACRTGALTVNQLRGAIHTAWRPIFDFYFEQEYPSASDAQKSELRDALWKTVLLDPGWATHCQDLVALAENAWMSARRESPQYNVRRPTE